LNVRSEDIGDDDKYYYYDEFVTISSRDASA